MIGVVLYGQLGNQMFQYAAARYLANARNTSVMSIGPRSSWRGTFFRRFPFVDAAAHPDAGQHNGVLRKAFGYGGSELNLRAWGKVQTLIERVMFDQVYLPETKRTESGAFVEQFDADFHALPDRTLLSGWFQSSKYWESDRGFARKLYQPSADVFQERDQLISDTAVDFDSAIAMHVRRGDYLDMRHGLSSKETGWVLPMSYYTAALKEFSDNQQVLVFSDDPDWAKQNFTGTRFCVQPKRAAEIDVFLISMCKHKIIANSSFSWWGAYMGDDQSGLTIAPEFHLGWHLDAWVPNDISQPNWKYLNINRLERAVLSNTIPPTNTPEKAVDAVTHPLARVSDSNPPVSVLIPCHNAEEWVGQAIESALSQTAEVEVIVYDDGSTDGSAEIAQSFGNKIKFVGGANKGAPTARNELLNQASYDWVQYLDADDYLEPNKISHQLAYVEKHPDVDVFYGPVWIEWRDKHQDPVADDLDRSPIPQPHDPWRLLALWQLPQTGGPIWRKSAILEVGGWKVDQPCCQEHELYLRLLKQDKKFMHTPTGGAIYRRFERGTVSTENLSLVRSERSKIELAIETHLDRQGTLSQDRKWAINQARFEMARNAWPVDKLEARNHHAAILRSMPSFSPASPAAPINYQRLYAAFGFEFAENVAFAMRTLGKIFGR